MNAQDLADLRPLGEGFATEFKRLGTSILGREICAFANAIGGVILIGVTDAGQVVGVQQHNRPKSAVQVIARSAEPPIAVEIESVGDVRPCAEARVTQEHGTYPAEDGAVGKSEHSSMWGVSAFGTFAGL